MFLNNIAVKGPQTDYNSEKVLMRVHWYILKTIQNLDKILINIECTDRSVSDEKSQYIMKQLKIVEFVCRSSGCSSVINKVLKIVQWRLCQNLKSLCLYWSLCLLLTMNKLISHYLIINIWSVQEEHCLLWMLKQQQIMNKLKILLSTELIIQQLDYDSDAEDIILTVNSSKKEWGFCLMQKVRMIDVVMSVNMIVVSEQMRNWSMMQANKNVADCWKHLRKSVHIYMKCSSLLNSMFRH
jgi:hypothetical protein